MFELSVNCKLMTGLNVINNAKILNKYETENGIVAEESGQIERVANGGDVLRTVGFYLYIGDDGKEYRVDYKADENGFQVS